MTDTKWELRTITDDIECTMDDSGIYCNINRVVTNEHSKGYIGQRVSVRVDIMDGSHGYGDGDMRPADIDYPVMSFVGKAENVRKAVIAYIRYHVALRPDGEFLSLEHASYIGSEIARAE
ncbi:hypothetical protein LCGC14_2862080, partial [marine sediment metagenome]